MNAGSGGSLTPLQRDIVVKVSCMGDMRRFRLTKGEETSWDELSAHCLEFFGDKVSAEWGLTWKDEDGDSITMASDADVEEALSSLPDESATLRLELAVEPSKPAAPLQPNPQMEEKVTWVMQHLDINEHAARQLLQSMFEGNEEALMMYHRARKNAKGHSEKGYGGKGEGKGNRGGGPLVRNLVKLTGMEQSEAGAAIAAAKRGNAAAQAKIRGALEGADLSVNEVDEVSAMRKKILIRLLNVLASGDLQAFEQEQMKIKKIMHGSNPWGKGKGGKGKGGKGKGGRGPAVGPLMHTLMKLTGMESQQSRETLDEAISGDETAQARIGAALEGGGGGEIDDVVDTRCRQMLQMLATGDMDGFRQAKQNGLAAVNWTDMMPSGESSLVSSLGSSFGSTAGGHPHTHMDTDR